MAFVLAKVLQEVSGALGSPLCQRSTQPCCAEPHGIHSVGRESFACWLEVWQSLVAVRRGPAWALQGDSVVTATW